MEDNYKKHNKQIIAYGDPYVKVNTSTQNNVKYHNITIWINRTAQVHLFNKCLCKIIWRLKKANKKLFY